MRNNRGIVLVHVLVMSVLISIIAMGIAKILLMRYVALQRLQDGGADRRAAEGYVQEIGSYWSANGSCSNPGITNFSYSGSAGGCSCQWTGSGAYTGYTIQAVAAGGTMPAWAQPPTTCGATGTSCCLAVQYGN